jgi:chromosome segregation ATPase
MDPIDVLALADFGSSPRGWVDAPFYTIRVRMRIRELRRELARQRGLLVAAERGREHVLASFVEALKAGSSETSRALRERLLAVDQRAAERGAALETASQMYSTDVAQIDARIGELEAQRLTQETAATEAEADLAQRAENRARAEARSKRVQIELRAAHDAARVAAGPDAKFAPPEHAKRIRDLDMEADVRATELRPLQQAFEDATEVTRARQAELRETRKQIAKLREDRRGLEKTASRQLDIRTAGAGEAERERLAAYAEAGRELLRAPGVVPVADANAANDAQRIVDERALSIEKYSRALTAYDAQGVRRGDVVLAVALVLTLALFAMVVVRLAS